MTNLIICKDCGEEKPHHIKGLCKTCYSRQKYYERREDPEYVEYCRKNSAKNRFENRLRCMYNLTVAEYFYMLESQGGGCWICGKTPEENGQRLSVDHCHSTGEIRGLLCIRCNTVLGFFGGDPEMFKVVVEYLETVKTGCFVPDKYRDYYSKRRK